MELFVIGVALAVVAIVMFISYPAAQNTPGWSEAHAQMPEHQIGVVVIVIFMIVLTLCLAGVGASFVQ